jgi:MFS family permease
MYRRALAQRDLRFLLGGLLVSMWGSWAYNVALLAVVYERTDSLGWVAAASLGRFLPLLVCSPYGGVIADRLEQVRLMVGCDVLAAASQAALAATIVADGPVPLIIGLAALTAVAVTPYEPAVAAVTPQVVQEDDLAAANSLRGVIENTVQIAGPATGALLLFVTPAWSIFALNAASYLLSAFLVSRVRYRSTPVDVTAEGTAGPLGQMLVGLREIRRRSGVALLVGLSVLASLVYGMDTVLLVGAAEQRLGMGADGFGVLVTGMAAGGLLAAAAVNPLASSRRLAAVLTLAMLVYCLPNVVIAFTESPAVAVAVQVVRGAGTLIVDVLAMTALQRAVAPEVTARVFGVFWALVIGAIALGALITPPVVAALGLETAIVVLAVAPAVLSLAAYPRLAGLDRASAAQAELLAGRVAILERTGLFAAAQRPVLERLAAASVETTAAPGEEIIREGEPADALYVLRKGSIEVRRGADTLATLPAGSWFGELGLLEGVPRTATVAATEPCDLLRIDGDEFVDALTAAPLASTALEGAKARWVAVRGHEPQFARHAVPEPVP